MPARVSTYVKDKCNLIMLIKTTFIKKKTFNGAGEPLIKTSEVSKLGKYIVRKRILQPTATRWKQRYDLTYLISLFFLWSKVEPNFPGAGLLYLLSANIPKPTPWNHSRKPLFKSSQRRRTESSVDSGGWKQAWHDGFITFNLNRIVS